MSNSDSELEEDEEEILVYVEFDGCGINDGFSKENLKLDMLGLDSDHPIMQVNGKFFEGTYEDAVGTYMFFDRDDNPKIDDPVFDKIPTLKYYNKTRKVLRMKRAFVTSRHEVIGDSVHSKCIPNMETIKEAGVPPEYQEEALAFWNDLRNNRMSAIKEYRKKQEFRQELRARGFEPESDSDNDCPLAVRYNNGEEEESEVSKDIENEDHSSDFNWQIENLENTLQMTEINKENEQNQRTLNVIDPGPSTSKDSTPWIDDNSQNDGEKSSMMHKIKCFGRGGKSSKGKVQKKTGKKKKVPAMSVSEKLFQGPRKNSTEDTNDHHDGEPKEDAEEQMDIDEMFIEENERLIAEQLNIEIPSVSEKEKRKQEKREARMREISEKLKAISETTNQPPNS